jgi:MFS family permease
MSAPVRRLPLLVAALSLGQIVGWGTTYYMPSVLAPALSRDLGLDPTGIYLGVTIMVALGGLASPFAGRLLDLYGAARYMPIAPLAIGLGHVLVAAFPSAVTWWVAWVLHGLAMPFGLTLAVTTFLTRTSGTAARRSIGVLTLLVGFAPSVFWPLTAVLESHLGWRGTLFVYAGLELGLLLPLQLWIGTVWIDRMPVSASAAEPGMPIAGPARDLEGRARRTAIVAMVVLFTAQGFAAWGLPLHLIQLFQDMGIGRAEAVAIAAASGASTIAARLIEVGFGHRMRPLSTSVAMVAVLAPALALLAAPIDRTLGAWIFILVWSGANGIMTVLRMTLPLSLFGAAAYGTLVGRMSLPQNLAFAAAPAVLAMVIAQAGTNGALAVSIAASLMALAAAIVLARAARGADGSPH